MYAFDVSQPRNPCVKWVYKTGTESPLRTSATYGVLADGRGVVAFSGFDTMAYLLDAKTARLSGPSMSAPIPIRRKRERPSCSRTGSSFRCRNTKIVVAEPNAGCAARIMATSFRLTQDGSQQWRYDTMEEAQPVRDRGDGEPLYGPSGAPIWTSPAVDEKRGVLYIGTGESNSPPVSKNTDAMIAIGLADGKERWSYQGTDKDIYLSAAARTPGRTSSTARQIPSIATSISEPPCCSLIPRAGRRPCSPVRIRYGLGDGSSHRRARVAQRPRQRQPLGGVHWGIAFWNNMVYAPITAVSDWYLNSFPVEEACALGLQVRHVRARRPHG